MVPVWNETLDNDHDHDHEWMNPANRRSNKRLIRAKRINRNPNKHKLFRDWYFWNGFLCCLKKELERVKQRKYRKSSVGQKQKITKKEVME